MSLIWTRHDLHYHGAGLWPLWDALNRAYYGGHPMLDSRFVAKLIDYFPSPHGIEVLSQGCAENWPLLCRIGGFGRAQIGVA